MIWTNIRHIESIGHYFGLRGLLIFMFYFVGVHDIVRFLRRVDESQKNRNLFLAKDIGLHVCTYMIDCSR